MEGRGPFIMEGRGPFIPAEGGHSSPCAIRDRGHSPSGSHPPCFCGSVVTSRIAPSVLGSCR